MSQEVQDVVTGALVLLGPVLEILGVHIVFGKTTAILPTPLPLLIKEHLNF